MKEGQSKRHRKIGFVLLCILIGIGLLKITLTLGNVLFFELSHPYEGDLYIFWTIGRGLLNGLLPYSDMFETKPPGIFLLSAASLALTGDHRLGYLLEVVSILAPAVICIIVGYRMLKKRERPFEQKELVLFGTFMTFILFLASLTGILCGLFKAEPFGAASVTLYGVLVLTNPILKPRMVAVLGILMFAACFMKETFLFSLLSCALLLCRTPKRFFSGFIMPATVAGVLGILTMTVLGYLEPYVNAYLPEMFAGRVSYWIPTWLSMLQGGMVLDRITRFSPFLGLTTALLIILSPLLWMKRPSGWDKTIVIGLFSLSAIFLSWAALPVSPLLNGHSLPNAMRLYVYAVLAVIGTGCAVLLLKKRNIRVARELIIAWLSPLASFFLVVIAFGAGGDFANHQIGTVIPYLMLLALLMLHHFSEHTRWNTTMKTMLAVMAVMLAMGSLAFPITNYSKKITEQHNQMLNDADNAAILDSVLTNCGEQRYLIIGELNGWMWVHTKHSPLGPGFYQYALNYPVHWHETNPLFTGSFKRNLKEIANILVIDPTYGRPVPKDTLEYISNHFTSSPWFCARDLEFPKDFQILFRKGSGPK